MVYTRTNPPSRLPLYGPIDLHQSVRSRTEETAWNTQAGPTRLPHKRLWMDERLQDPRDTVDLRAVCHDAEFSMKPMQTASVRSAESEPTDLFSASPLQTLHLHFHTLTPKSGAGLIWLSVFDNAKAVSFQNIFSIIQRQMCNHRFDYTQTSAWKKKKWVSTLSLLIKRTSRLNLLRVRYFAHGGRDTFQIVIKDCPKTTHAFSGVAAILGSWHVSVFAQFFVHADRLMESVTPLRFLLLACQ